MAEGLKRFFSNGGVTKTLLVLLLAATGWLIRTTWAASKYDSRIITVESKVVQHETILTAVPKMQEDISVIKNDIGWIKRNLR